MPPSADADSKLSLDTQLAQLVDAQLVHPAGDQDPAYLFKHTLVQSVAYESLLRQERKRLHHLIGEALEQSYPNRHDELASVLAYHFDQAGEDARALGYFLLAGDATLRVYATAEAISHYRRALELAKALGATKELAHLYAHYASALELSGDYDRALALYEEMERAALDHADEAMELDALIAHATLRATPSPVQDETQAQALSERALALARAGADRPRQAKILWNLMLRSVWGGGSPLQAIAYGEQSLLIARELGLREQLAFTLNDLAYAYIAAEQWANVGVVLDQVRPLWRELGNLAMLADSLSNATIFYLRGGDNSRCIESAEEGMRISASIDNRWGLTSSRMFVAHAYLDLGEVDQAIQTLQDGLHFGDESGHATGFIGCRADLGWVLGILGAVRQGIAQVQEAQRLSANTPMSFLRVYPFPILARLHLLNGDVPQAEGALQEARRLFKPDGIQMLTPIFLPLAEAELALAKQEYTRMLEVLKDLLAYFERTRTRAFVADALYLQSRALMAMGRKQEAKTSLLKARATAEAITSRRMLWPILALLSDWEREQGNPAEVDALLDEARAILDYVANRIGDPELRATFLNSAPVRALA